VKAFQEAEAHDGPSLIIAYSSCIATATIWCMGWSSRNWLCSRVTGRDALQSRTARRGKNPFQLDSKAPSIRLKEYSYREARYTMLARSNPELAANLLKKRRTMSSASGAFTPLGQQCRAEAKRRTSLPRRNLRISPNKTGG